MKVLTAEQMREADRRAIALGIHPLVLMENAGERVVEFLAARYAPLDAHRIVVFCGKGNNGGDGFVVARLLARKRIAIQVLCLAKAADLSRDARVMHGRLLRIANKSAIRSAHDPESLRDLFAASDIIVDDRLGRLVPLGDIAGFVKAMVHYHDHVVSERRHAQYRIDYIDRFSLDKVVHVHARALLAADGRVEARTSAAADSLSAAPAGAS